VREGIDPDVDLHRAGDRTEFVRGHLSLLAVIGLGGAIGSCLRYAVALAYAPAYGAFPWGIFGINVVGCALIGVVVVLVTEVLASPHRLLRPFAATGVLGGFTTMSTYAVQARDLGAGGRPATEAAYLVATLVVALLAVGAGVLGTRQVCGIRPLVGYRP
jgi:fluoride exporter